MDSSFLFELIDPELIDLQVISQGPKSEPPFAERFLVGEVKNDLAVAEVLNPASIGDELDLQSPVGDIHQLLIFQIMFRQQGL